MRGPHNIFRLIVTGATFERTGALAYALEEMKAPRALRVLVRIVGLAAKPFGMRGDPSLSPVLRALTALGPAYIKFGQILSTRPDIVGDQLAADLKVLQDRLPPFSLAEARVTIERELEADADALFSEISEPIAAASIAQVHKAVERETGRQVAVKVLRPGIERAFQRDIDAFYLAAWLVNALAPKARRLKPREVVAHFEGVVDGELDLRSEAAAAAEFEANTRDDEGFRVPQVVWPLSSRRVMTTEWVTGTPMGDVPALAATGANLSQLGDSIVQHFLTHALRDGFFHADMHQGNLKLGPDGAIVALDFGIMGRLDKFTRRVYAEILMGFLKKDYRRVAEVHFEAGYVPADRDIDAFAQALRSVAEPIFGQDASRISMARLLGHLFDVTERFGMETRTDLILLQRTMVVVEGVGRSLDPALNIWEVARPVVTRYIADNLGPRAVVRDLRDTAIVLSRFGPLLPAMAERALIRSANPPPPPAPAWPRWIPWIVAALGWGVVLGLLIGRLG